MEEFDFDPNRKDFDADHPKYWVCCGEMHSKTGGLLLAFGGILISIGIPLLLYLFTSGGALLYASIVLYSIVGLVSVTLMVGIYAERPALIFIPMIGTVLWFVGTILTGAICAIWIGVAENSATETILAFMQAHTDADSVIDDMDSAEYVTTTTTTIDPYHMFKPRDLGDSEIARHMRAWRVVLCITLASVIAVPSIFTLFTVKTFIQDKLRSEIQEEIDHRQRQSAKDRGAPY